MTTQINYREQAAEAFRHANAAREQIVEGLTEERLKELTAQMDAAFADYDKAVAMAERDEKLARMSADADAKDEARKIAAGAGHDVARAYEPDDDNVFTPEQRRRRTQLINRFYFDDQKLSDEEMVLMHRQTNDERRFWQALQTPTKHAQAFADLMVGDFPNDVVLARHNSVDLDPDRVRAVSTTQKIGADADGGYLVPEGFQAELIVAMKAYGPLNDAMFVRVLTTPMGNDIPWPNMDDTGNKGVQINEATDADFAKVAFGSITLHAYKYTSKAFVVTREVIQDSALPIEQIVRDAMAERLGRKLNEDFTQADGSGKPHGIADALKGLTGSPQTVVSGAANTLKVDDIINAIHKIDPAYRNMRCRFMFNDNTALAARKLKDGENRYYLTPDIYNATRMRLFGYPIVINQDMESYGAGKYPIIFGDFQNFVVRMVRGFVVRRLDELWARSDQVGFVGFCRHDSRLIQHRAFSIIDSDASL